MTADRDAHKRFLMAEQNTPVTIQCERDWEICSLLAFDQVTNEFNST